MLFSLFAPLLGESTLQRPYIRQFAAEAFAYLLRKAKGEKLTEVVRYALQPLRNSPSSEDSVEGLSIFFVEAVKVSHETAFCKMVDADQIEACN